MSRKNQLFFPKLSNGNTLEDTIENYNFTDLNISSKLQIDYGGTLDFARSDGTIQKQIYVSDGSESFASQNDFIFTNNTGSADFIFSMNNSTGGFRFRGPPSNSAFIINDESTNLLAIDTNSLIMRWDGDIRLQNGQLYSFVNSTNSGLVYDSVNDEVCIKKDNNDVFCLSSTQAILGQNYSFDLRRVTDGAINMSIFVSDGTEISTPVVSSNNLIIENSSGNRGLVFYSSNVNSSAAGTHIINGNNTTSALAVYVEGNSTPYFNVNTTSNLISGSAIGGSTAVSTISVDAGITSITVHDHHFINHNTFTKIFGSASMTINNGLHQFTLDINGNSSLNNMSSTSTDAHFTSSHDDPSLDIRHHIRNNGSGGLLATINNLTGVAQSFILHWGGSYKHS